jgi:hypothetical protein
MAMRSINGAMETPNRAGPTIQTAGTAGVLAILRRIAGYATPTAYGQKTKTAAKMAVVQASTMKQLSAPFPKAPHGSA